jgi:hypothetical protein
MKTERPVLDETKVKAFLNGSSPRKSEKKKAIPRKVTEISKKSDASDVSQVTTKKVVTKAQEQVVKFMVELPLSLRRKIKFKSVEEDIPMNNLIIQALKNHFG